MVPLFGPFVGQIFSLKALLSAGVALLGLGIMSWESGAWAAGDFWMIGCALCYAVYVLYMDAVVHRHESLKLTAVQLLTVTALGFLWFVHELRAGSSVQVWDAKSIGVVLYLGVIATAVTLWAQAIAQKRVSAYETALMYTLEPVFALIFSFWWLNETLGIRGLLGSGLILMAMVVSQLQLPKSL
jgi:drug/metabolite transporter (DMT)-like permease